MIGQDPSVSKSNRLHVCGLSGFLHEFEDYRTTFTTSAPNKPFKKPQFLGNCNFKNVKIYYENTQLSLYVRCRRI